MFSTPEDSRNEEAVAQMVRAAWDCQVIHMGDKSTIDWLAVKNGEPKAIMELKCRRNTWDKYPTVFFSLRKWMALQMASVGFGVKGIFMVRFTDSVRWIEVGEAVGHPIVMGGNSRGVATNDIEPVIQVPVGGMSRLDRGRIEAN